MDVAMARVIRIRNLRAPPSWTAHQPRPQGDQDPLLFPGYAFVLVQL